jgi:hypothetical protein
MHQLAFEYSQTVVKSDPGSIHDALNLGDCSSAGLLSPETIRQNEATIHAAASITDVVALAPSPGSLAVSFYVASTGSDSASTTGSLSDPFATLQRARDAIRTLRKQIFSASGGATVNPAFVYVKGGTYYFNQTLVRAVLLLNNFQGKKNRTHPVLLYGVDVLTFQPLCDCHYCH